jgi:hypothetical protein
LGAELLATGVTLDATADTLSLARSLAAHDVFGVIQCGAGASDALLAQAQAATSLLKLQTPALAGVVALGAQPFATGKHAISVRADASLALPLLVSGLAQRHPQARVRALQSTDAVKAPALA